MRYGIKRCRSPAGKENSVVRCNPVPKEVFAGERREKNNTL